MPSPADSPSGAAHAHGTDEQTIPSGHEPISIVSVSDSESYLKWATQPLSTLPDVEAHVYLVDNPILPTDEQIANAVADTAWEGHTIPVVSRRRTRSSDLPASTGHRPRCRDGPDRRPALPHRERPRTTTRTHLRAPGMGLPASGKGMNYRRLMDAFLAHSFTEVSEYRAVSAMRRVPAEILLGRLPMLRSESLPEPPAPHSLSATPRTLVFAPQAKVPASAAQREAIIAALAEFAERHPESRAIVKMRSRPGEHETHHEQHSYFDIIADFKKRAVPGAERLEIGYGPLTAFLTPGAALVTVSSTAALESIDRGIPTPPSPTSGSIGDCSTRSTPVRAPRGPSPTLRPGGSASRIGCGWRRTTSTPTTEVCAAPRPARRPLSTGAVPDRRRSVWKQKRMLMRAEVRTFTPTPFIRVYRRIRYGR